MDKTKLALAAAPHLTLELMARRFDWSKTMEGLVAKIREWNR